MRFRVPREAFAKGVRALPPMVKFGAKAAPGGIVIGVNAEAGTWILGVTSSVAQVGYMVLGVSLVSALGLTAALLHMFNHALMKGALFMALGCVSFRLGGTDVAQMKGLGRSMPWTMAAFVAGGLSLIGVPLTVGFISKWYLVLAALEQGWWPLVVAILLSSLLAVIYVWRVVEVAYFQPSESRDIHREAPLALLLPTWILVLANVYFGIDTRLTVGVAEQAAAALLGAGR